MCIANKAIPHRLTVYLILTPIFLRRAGSLKELKR